MTALKRDWPADEVKLERCEFEVDWRRRLQAIQAVVETRQGCVITIEPIGRMEHHDDGAYTYRKGKIKVTPL